MTLAERVEGPGSNNPPKAPNVPPAMARVLLNLYRGHPAWCHLKGRSMFGGSGQTERALRRRGWVGGYQALELTSDGREVAAALATKETTA